MHCRWRSSYQEGRVGIPLTGLTPPHFCLSHAEAKQKNVHMQRSNFNFIVSFVDIDGSVAHHC